jgi:hypothetical protein
MSGLPKAGDYDPTLARQEDSKAGFDLVIDLLEQPTEFSQLGFHGKTSGLD